MFTVDIFFRIRFRLTESDYVSCFVPFPFSLVIVNCLILFSFGTIWFRVTKFDNDIFLVIIISRVVYFIFSASDFFCIIRYRVPKSDCSSLYFFFFRYNIFRYYLISFREIRLFFSPYVMWLVFPYFFFLIRICLCSNKIRFCVMKSDFVSRHLIFCFNIWFILSHGIVHSIIAELKYHTTIIKIPIF